MRLRLVVIATALSLSAALVRAEGVMPSLGYAGVNSAAASDHSGQDCSTCHSSFGKANSDPTGSLTVIIGNYNPGVAQPIRILLQHPSASRWGFQITIREVTDQTISAGDFTAQGPADPVQAVCDNGTQFGSPAPCNNQRQFGEHKNAPRGPGGQTFEFDLLWNPPSQEVGRLVVYVAAVAADGDGTASGDRVYTYTQTLLNIGTCSIGKKPTLQTVLNGASFQPTFSSNGMVSIFGLGFQASGYMRTAGLGDFVNGGFPTTLGCVAVQVSGPGIPQPVMLPIAYVQQDQINAQMPQFIGTGPVTLQVIENPGQPNQLVSDLGMPTGLQSLSPAFFVFGTSTSIAAQLAGTGTIIADPNLVAGARSAHAGEIVSLYGTGFGATTPAVAPGQLASGQAKLNNPIIVTIGTTTLASTDIQYAGLSPGSISGLYQFNLRVPASTPSGNVPVSISINGSQTQSGVTIPVQ